ncbi:hypothetical protein ACFE04_026643 [Oxalis oulophora]
MADYKGKKQLLKQHQCGIEGDCLELILSLNDHAVCFSDTGAIVDDMKADVKKLVVINGEYSNTDIDKKNQSNLPVVLRKYSNTDNDDQISITNGYLLFLVNACNVTFLSPLDNHLHIQMKPRKTRLNSILAHQ